jgi:predicted small integral membrane protein
MGERAVGSPSGHGRWGFVDVDPADGDRLVCHDCGHAYVALGVHIGMVHGGVREYRLRHGLTLSTSLAAPGLAARLADAARPAIGRLEEVRSPDHLDAPQELITRGLRLSRRVGRPGGGPPAVPGR